MVQYIHIYGGYMFSSELESFILNKPIITTKVSDYKEVQKIL